MHNAAFKHLNLNFRYETVDVLPETLREFMTTVRYTYAGLNVTIPHKVSVIDHLDELSKEAELIGAVNTVKCGEKLVGYNTDGVGCVRALAEAGVNVKDKNILIIGTGGAGRAIAFQLSLEGANLSLSDLRKESAEHLSKDIRSKVGCDVDVVESNANKLAEALKEADVFINSTPVGMSPNVSESIIEAALLPNDIAVMDLVYNPLETKLLRLASERGCKTIGGLGMLVHQGAESLRIWLDIEPPVDIMRKAALEKLRNP